MAAALDHFSDRLKAGAKTDLLELAQIAFIKSRTAWVEFNSFLYRSQLSSLTYHRRVFWQNGLRTVAAVANSDVKDIVPILIQVGLIQRS
jgi:hypothetical protein